jgi:hypothetical protein
MRHMFFEPRIGDLEDIYARDYKQLEATICSLQKYLTEILDDFKNIETKGVMTCQDYENSNVNTLSTYVYHAINRLQNSKICRNEIILESINKLTTNDKQ